MPKIPLHDKILGVPQNNSLQKIYVLLPAFNEAEALSQLIPHLLTSLRQTTRPFEIIVVNDGSADGTAQITESFRGQGVRELRHDINRGYGAALKTGLIWVAQNAGSDEAVIMMDADNTQDPVYIPSLVARLEQGYDVVTASYSMTGGQADGVPWLRRLMSLFLNGLFRLTYRRPGVETYTNGFRVYRVAAVQRVYQTYKEAIIEETGFPGGTEFFLKVLGLGGKAAQIPFHLHYDRRGKSSKIRLLATITRYLKLLVKGHRYAHP